MFLAELRDRLVLRSSHNGSVIRLGVFVAEGGGGAGQHRNCSHHWTTLAGGGKF